jgi:mannitol-1-phosphate 5-dehydrogenase
LQERFQDKVLGNTIFSVGCDIYRKLSHEDRLAGPIHAAKSLGKPYDKILKVIEAAVLFRATDEKGNFFPSDEMFFAEAEKGIGYLLKNVCNL